MSENASETEAVSADDGATAGSTAEAMIRNVVLAVDWKALIEKRPGMMMAIALGAGLLVSLATMPLLRSRR